MKSVGLIINPISGMGGRVGLKGTDGNEILNKAIWLGAEKDAPAKALKAMEKLLSIKDKVLFLTSSGDMGENQCKELDMNFQVVYQSKICSDRFDTLEAAGIMEKKEVDLILFVGGDGTARDIFDAVGTRVVTIGIPAGVKIHSPIYGNTPESAGELALQYITGNITAVKEAEVIDLDEDAYRNNIVSTRLYGYLKLPYAKKYLQNKKAPTPLSEEDNQKAIALDIIDNMEDEVYYLIGPGTTTKAIMDKLGLRNTLLGVDIVKNKKLIKLDCNEKEILSILYNKDAKLVIAPTGGQGYLLGRGNQQISPGVIERVGKKNILIISTNSKLIELNGEPLLVYTGDKDMDRKLTGYYRVKIGYGSEVMYRIAGE